MVFPDLSAEDKKALIEWARARLVTLRDELEKTTLTKKLTHQKRGAVAELRDFIGQMQPQTRDEQRTDPAEGNPYR